MCATMRLYEFASVYEYAIVQVRAKVCNCASVCVCASVYDCASARMCVSVRVYLRSIQEGRGGYSRAKGKQSHACTLPKRHVVLINALVHALGWPDLLLTEHLILGASAIGDIPDSGVFRAEDVPASQDERDLNHEVWNASLVRSIMAEAKRADKQANLCGLWDKTQSEV
eukprot:6212569-Pleurochrysis_carterae.AAC.2